MLPAPSTPPHPSHPQNTRALRCTAEAFYWPQYLGLDSMRVMYEWMDRNLQV